MKIVFIGFREDDFIKIIIGDCLSVPCLSDAEFAIVNENEVLDSNKAELYINLLQKLNEDINMGKAVIRVYDDRRRALMGADYVIALPDKSISPYIESDYKIPLKYGLKQTYADTVGIGGIFRGLRVIPKMMGIAYDIMEICPDAWLLSYIDPMSIAGMLHYIYDIAPEDSKTTAQLFVSSVGLSLPSVISSSAGGFILENYGVRIMTLCSLTLIILALTFAVLQNVSVRKIHNK
jgi:alpha-galactosidase/6-phospho-beta-glucosidase family protein